MRILIVIFIFIFNICAKADTPDWIHTRLTSDFGKFHSGLHRKQFRLIDSIIRDNKVPHLAHFQIIDNIVYAYTHDNEFNRFKVITKKLKTLIAEGHNFPNVEFVIGLEDAWDNIGMLQELYPALSIDDLPPILVFAANKNSSYRKHYVLFVDDYTVGTAILGNRRGWPTILKDIEEASQQSKWENKIDKVMWRGLDTDCIHYAKCENSPRSKLVKTSTEYPDIIDAKYAKPKYFYDFIKKNLRPLMLRFSIPPFLSTKKQITYRMLASLDGYTSTYPGVLWRLYSNSIVLKQESANEQWFYDLLIAWKHYIPIKNDVSDIIEKAQWVINNKQRAYEIVKEANSLVQHNLMPAHIDEYIKKLIDYHHGLQKYNLEKQTLQIAN